MAPMTSVPSRPRFTRPLFSVRHSPRLTKRNGVLMRMAPPRTANATPLAPVLTAASAMSGGLSECRGLRGHLADARHDRATAERVGEEDRDEQDPLQHVDRRVWQIEDALEQAA